MQPLLFTRDFRRKMAELGQPQRLEWLASLAVRFRRHPTPQLAQELAEVARGCRLALVDSVEKQLGTFDGAHLRAVLEVPREQFVRPEDLERSADDSPLPLDDAGLATISAPHAYLLSFRLLELASGDALVELGSGSGYGAALAEFITGPRGRVTSIEIDATLAAWAARLLAHRPTVQVIHGDAETSTARWGQAKKIVATFAVTALPGEWLDRLPDGGRLVAPVGPRDRDQRLVLARRAGAKVIETDHGAVRYVRNRSER